MTRVVVAAPAAQSLDDILATRPLPANARGRVIARLRQLEQFPSSGREVPTGRWAGRRVLTGPWWFVVIYRYDEDADTVVVVAMLDGRTANASDVA